MNNFNPMPDSISHKQLHSLMKTAEKEMHNCKMRRRTTSEEQEAFEELLTRWAALSQKLVQALRHKHDVIIEERTPRSLMALGALEVHLNMAIQAQQASRPK